MAELTDKDAFLLMAASAKVKPLVVFLAGATAFTITTTIFVTAGSVLMKFVPVEAIRVVGGVVMISYGLWEARGILGAKAEEEAETKVGKAQSLFVAFITLVAALAFLDMAGDATEILTIVFVGHFGNALLVFGGCLTGLVAATGVETILGSRLGHILTPRKLSYVSSVVFVLVGVSILALTLS